MATPVGIDLGTTNSVACIQRGNRTEVISVDGSPLLPSVLAIPASGELMVGQRARSHAVVAPQEVISSAKRFIGDGSTVWKIHGKEYTPVDVAAHILARLKQATEAYLGESVKQAVITVPAYFNNNQRLATRQAGEQAGWEVLELLPEPEAAAISYALDRGKNQTIVVYDLGGGTFDISVLEVKGNRFIVKAVGGDAHLGGDDFDRVLGGYLVERMAEESHTDLNALRQLVVEGRALDGSIALPLRQGVRKVLQAAETAKRDLSKDSSTEVLLTDVLGESLDITLHRDVYEGLIGPYVEQTIVALKETLRAARLRVGDVARVVLVGGSTRNLLVSRRLKEEVKEPWSHDQVDQAVAQGAAIVARHLTSGIQPMQSTDKRPEKLIIQSVIPFSLGVRATKGGEEDHFHILMNKNSAVPRTAVHEFSTFRTNQTSTDIAVFQGEGSLCAENLFIGGFRLSGIPPAPAGKPRIRVEFRMDNKDLLTVEASCDDTRMEKVLDVNMISRFEETKSPPAEVDIMFLIDTSGSMSGELEGVKKLCQTFADQVSDSGIKCSLGLMAFDKECAGPKYKWDVHGPMEASKLSPAIQSLKIGALGGCGCYIGEEGTIPVVEHFAQSFPKNNRTRIGILISDEVGNNAVATARIQRILNEAQICLYVIGVARSCHETLAQNTNGHFWDIEEQREIDLSVVLNAIAVEITNLVLT